MAAFANTRNVLQEVQLNGAIVTRMRQIPRADIPDLPDRIIAATALFHSVPVLSRDGRIRSSDIQTVG